LHPLKRDTLGVDVEDGVVLDDDAGEAQTISLVVEVEPEDRIALP
jgi:hypothetical protein